MSPVGGAGAAAAMGPVGGVGTAAAMGPATTGESLSLPETIPNVGRWYLQARLGMAWLSGETEAIPYYKELAQVIMEAGSPNLQSGLADVRPRRTSGI